MPRMYVIFYIMKMMKLNNGEYDSGILCYNYLIILMIIVNKLEGENVTEKKFGE